VKKVMKKDMSMSEGGAWGVVEVGASNDEKKMHISGTTFYVCDLLLFA